MPRSRETFVARDYLGRSVVCHEATWRRHILFDNPEMRSFMKEIRETIAMPDGIAMDRAHPDRLVYYGVGRVPARTELMDKVFVRYRKPLQADGSDTIPGLRNNDIVLTAFLERKRRTQESIIR